MRRLIADTLITLNGCYTDTKNVDDWIPPGGGDFAWSTEILRRVDTIVLGRTTYEEFAQFWPTAKPEETGIDPFIIRAEREYPKVVFSRSIAKTSWGPVTVVREDPITGMRKLKASPGGDLAINGSGTLVGALHREGLIDEYRLRVVPTVLGTGKPLFVGGLRRDLKLLSATTFSSGIVGLHLVPKER